MGDILSIREVARRIKHATTFASVFGALPPGDVITKKSFLRKEFAYLAHVVHPDHAPHALVTEAQETFKKLNDLRKLAEEAIQRNVYDEKIAALTPDPSAGFELVSKVGTYELSNDVFRTGDFSVIYRGRQKSDQRAVIAKVAIDPTMNLWLEREAVLLKKLRDAPRGSPLESIKRFMPNLLDTFIVANGRERHRVTILGFARDMVSISDIIDAFPHGLEPPQAAWVMRRIMAQTLAAHMLGVTHGAITPDHVLVDPFSHEPLHIGWPHALENGRLTHVVDRWRDLYPKEVFKHSDVDYRTDIYMAGATTLRLLGGTMRTKSVPSAVPKKLAALIERCLDDSPARRPQDARILLDDVTRVVRNEWGRGYRPLMMPIR